MYGLTPLGDSANAAAFDTNALGQLSTGPQTGLSLTTTASGFLGKSFGLWAKRDVYRNHRPFGRGRSHGFCNI